MSAPRRKTENGFHRHDSTGPRTEEGDLGSRGKALKHGLSAKELALPGEDPAEIQRGLDGWYEACKPVGPVEEGLVAQIALASLRTQRLDRVEMAVIDNQVGNAEIEWDREQDRRLKKYQRMLLRDSEMATLYLRSFGAGVSWLLSQWEELASAFAESGGCWTDPAMIREAIQLRGSHDACISSGYEFAHLALSCVEVHENIPALATLLSEYDPEEGSLVGVHGSSVIEARSAMRLWIDRQMADLRERDRHFRDSDPKSRAGAKTRAFVPHDTPQNRKLLRDRIAADKDFARAMKTLEELQADRKAAAKLETGFDRPATPSANLPNKRTSADSSPTNRAPTTGYVAGIGKDATCIDASDGSVNDPPADAKGK